MAPVPAENRLPARIESLLKEHPRGMTTSDITRSLDSNRNSIAKYLEILLTSGIVERKQVGASRVYTLTKKVSVSSLLDFTSDLVVILDARKKIVMVNRSLLRFFALDREDLEGVDLASAPAGMLRGLGEDTTLFNPVQEVISERSGEVNGSTHQFLLKCIPTLFEDRDTGYTINISDISVQKRHEVQLRESEAKYRAVVEDQTDLICRRRPDGTITFVNSAYLRFFGQEPGDGIGRTVSPDAVTGNTSGPSAGIPFFSRPGFEQDVLLDNGERRCLQWMNTSLSDQSGTVTEIQSVGRDITIQRQREKEILLRQCAIESSEQATVICDMMSRIVFANRAFRKLFRCGDEGQAIGKPLDQYITQSGPATNVGQIMHSTRTTGRWDGVFRGIRDDGSRITVRVHTTVLADDQFFPFHGIAVLTKVTGESTRRQANNTHCSPPAPAVPGILTLDPRGRIVNVNDTFLAMSGYANGLPFLGKSAGRVLARRPGNSTGKTKNPWAGINGTTDGEIRTREGRSIPVYVTAREILDASGRCLCSELAVGSKENSREMDIGEMFEYVPNPACMIDPGKKVVLWNRAIENFTGTRKDGIVGTTRYQEVLSEIMRGPPLIDMVGKSETEIHHRYPASMICGDVIILERYVPGSGSGEGTCYYEKASPVFSPDGVLTGALEIIQDITERKRYNAGMSAMRNGMDLSLSAAIRFLNRCDESTGR